MFMLYAVILGIALGFATGGRPARLADLRFTWGHVALIGLFIQGLLFSTPVGNALGGLAPVVYVGSNCLVLAAVLRNLAIPGLWLVALGAVSNGLAIVANGGYMPASPAALAAIGHGGTVGYSNSAELVTPALAPLTDIFAMPTWLPFANVFSIGDVLISAGIALAIVVGMHGLRPRGLVLGGAPSH